jgi:hypothetical protein
MSAAAATVAPQLTCWLRPRNTKGIPGILAPETCRPSAAAGEEEEEEEEEDSVLRYHTPVYDAWRHCEILNAAHKKRTTVSVKRERVEIVREFDAVVVVLQLQNMLKVSLYLSVRAYRVGN